MGISSVVRTMASKDLKYKTDAADFNEALYDHYSDEKGWDFTVYPRTIKTSAGREVPFVSELNLKKGVFKFLGYEADEPSEHPSMYDLFSIEEAQVIASQISFGYLILSHEVEGHETEYYFISPDNAVEVDIVSAILDQQDISEFTNE